MWDATWDFPGGQLTSVSIAGIKDSTMNSKMVVETLDDIMAAWRLTQDSSNCSRRVILSRLRVGIFLGSMEERPKNALRGCIPANCAIESQSRVLSSTSRPAEAKDLLKYFRRLTRHPR